MMHTLIIYRIPVAGIWDGVGIPRPFRGGLMADIYGCVCVWGGSKQNAGFEIAFTRFKQTWGGGRGRAEPPRRKFLEKLRTTTTILYELL